MRRTKRKGGADRIIYIIEMPLHTIFCFIAIATFNDMDIALWLKVILTALLCIFMVVAGTIGAKGLIDRDTERRTK